MPTSGSRTEFLAVDALGSANDIKYGRSGGWFVSTKKAIFIGILFIATIVVVGLLVYYFANRPGEKLAVEAEKDGNTSVITGPTEPPIPPAKLRLPGDVAPTLYRLKLDPYLDDPDPDGNTFMYKGSVSIVINCFKSTDKVKLHSKRLQIGDNVIMSIYNETAVAENTGSVPVVTTPTVLPSTPGNMSVNGNKETQTGGPTLVTTANNSTVPVPSIPSGVPTTVSTKQPSELPTPPPPPVAETGDNSTVVPNNSTIVPRNTTEIPKSRRRKRSFSHRRHQRRESHPATTIPPKTTFAPGTPPKVKDRVVEEKLEMITFIVEPPLQAGQMYQLDIPFSGLLRNDSLYGFYPSQYKDSNNNTRWMAATQFEAPHARDAFPCFDEPAMKAEFEISIARSTQMKTISNMPLKSTEEIKEKPGRVWDHYYTTPIMSTYLVAYIVAPSDFIPSEDTMAVYLKQTGGNATGPEFKIYTRKELAESGNYAASIGPRILEFYERYFDVPYPLPKLHMAAIPDFAAGAMENWGLLNYRETFLLYDKNSSSMNDKETVAIVVAHEIAHQWFGNLVTMKWWSDLWLNEGFANYMQYLGSDHVEPSWAMLDKFVEYDQQRVMLLDSLSNTHSVSSRVDNPSQISEIFDEISYSKGASLIRMLNNSITEDILRKGLTKYLNKWKYNNAEESDLWEALTEETRASGNSLLPENLSLKDVMDSWTKQEGYPVVTVTRDYEAGSAELSQMRFSLENKTYDILWHIPVSYATQEEMSDAAKGGRLTLPRTWMKKEKTIKIPNLVKPKSEDWVLFNIHSTAYYRVNYDDKNWALLSGYLMNPKPGTMIPPVTRAQLIDDIMNLARAGLIGYDVALNMTQYLAMHEKDLIPWKTAMRNLRFLDTMLRETPAYGSFLDYVLKIVSPMKKVVGFKARQNETQLETLLRPTILLGLSEAGDPEVRKWAVALFKQWMNSSNPDTYNPIPVDLRDIVYREGVRAGDRDEWYFVLERFKTAESKPSERAVLLDSLASTSQEWLLVTLLEKSFATDGEIRRQDSYRVWRMMPNSALGARVAFNYIRNNWVSVHDHLANEEYLVSDILSGAISGLTTELDLKDVKEFRDTNIGKFSFAERKLKQEIEALERRVDWHNKHYNTIVTWLREHTH